MGSMLSEQLGGLQWPSTHGRGQVSKVVEQQGGSDAAALIVPIWTAVLQCVQQQG